MNHVLVAIFFGAGVGGWVYSKLARHTGGGNQQSAYIGAGVTALLAFILMLTLANTILK